MNLSNEAKKFGIGDRMLRLAAAMLTAVSLIATSAAPSHARYNDNPGEEGGGGSGSIKLPPPPYVFPDEGFTWAAPSRFNGWMSNWAEFGGTPRTWQMETYNDNYVNPKTWYIYVMGCQLESDYNYDNYPDAKDEDGNPLYEKPRNRYTWKWNGKTKYSSTDCYTVLDFPAQGNYWVEMTVVDADGAEMTRMLPVQVKDYLVVVLGDSSASGEGAVDYNVYPNWPGNDNADWIDDRCHRSNNAGGAQAAALLEGADPHTSVTFLSFACSGATLDTVSYRKTFIDTFDPYEFPNGFQRGTGITGPYCGMEPPKNGEGPYQLPSQVDQLNYALTGHHTHAPRKVDTLIAAGGINDVRFADLVGTCILYNDCMNVEVGDHDDHTLDEQYDSDVARVPAAWKKFGDQLDAYGIEVRSGMKLALEYPSFFERDSGLQCPELFDDITALGSWDFYEIGVAEAVWAPKLNEAVEEGAELAGFEYVNGIFEAFKKHGMCAADRYLNTATDSLISQGDSTGEYVDGKQSDTTGVCHPNKKGYAAYAQILIDRMAPLFENHAPVAKDDTVQAAIYYGSKFNVLTNDTDPDVDPLAARVVTEPLHGHVELKPNGEASYRANGFYAGPDSFTYAVSDGEFEDSATVNITVTPAQVVTTDVLSDTSSDIGGLLGSFALEPPFVVVFDKPLRPRRGFISQIPGQAAVSYSAPEVSHRRRIKIPYTVHTVWPSPDLGSSVRGVLKIQVLGD